MKKFLLTLIVTMLTCIGAWADGTQTLDDKVMYVGDQEYWNPSSLINWGAGDPDGSVTLSNLNGGNEFVTAVFENGSIKLTANKATIDPVVLTFTATKSYYYNPGGPATNVKECTVNIEVKGFDCEITISPTPVTVSQMNKGDNASYTYSASWTKNGTPVTDTHLVSTSASSSEASVVKCTNTNQGGILGMSLEALGGGTATITVRSTYKGQVEEESFDIEVFDPSMATSLSLGAPDPSSTFYQGTSVTVPVTFAPETAVLSATVSPDNQGVTASVVGNTLTITSTESANVGNYTVTVNPVSGSDASAQSVNVTVKDKTHASSIDAPETVSVAYGSGTANYAKEFTISFEPATAQIAIDNENSNIPSDVTCSLSADYKTLTVNANNATEASTGKIVLKSGDLTKEISLNVVAPKHVTGVTLKEGETALGETKTIDKDATFTITAEVAPEDAADATLTWTNSDSSVASFNETTGEVKGLKAGETTITATSKSIAGQPAKEASVTVIVEETLTATVDNFPAAAIALGANFTPSVNVTNTGISADNYEVSYTIEPSDVFTRDAESGQFTAVKAGTATVTINVNATEAGLAAHYKNAAPIQKVVEVKKNEYTLAISVDNKLFKTGDGGNANISITSVKLNGNDATSETEKAKYSISYDVIPAYTDVSVGETSGAVTVDASAAKGQATIVATLTPSDPANNTTATASVTLTIADVITGGATIKKDGDFYVIDVPYPGALAQSLSKADESGIDDLTTAYEALIAAEKVKFTGDINNDDMKKFSTLLGTSANNAGRHCDATGNLLDPDFNDVLTTLDMSGATLVEPATTGPSTHSFTNNFWGSRMFGVTDITLPTPAASASVLPANFGNWCPNVKTVTIPEGWTGQTVIQGDQGKIGAFNGSATAITKINLPASLTAEQYMFNSAALQSIHFAEGTTAIGENAFFSCPVLTEVNFPASLETIGASAFRNCEKLPTVDMKACTELTVIPESAFENCYALETLNLPPNLTDIKKNAFLHFMKLKVIIFPNQLDRIEAGAFQNYGGSNSLTDVFFTGTTKTPSYVDAYAFTPNTQMGNNTVVDAEGDMLGDGTPAISNGTITRYSYRNGLDANNQPYLTTIMHFPVGYTQYYTDPTRLYSDAGRLSYVAPTDGSNVLNPNRKADFNYQPAGWTDEFIALIENKNEDLNEEFAGLSVGKGYFTDSQGNQIHNYINGGYSDRTYGASKIWPSQQQMYDGYAIAHVGYLWNGTEMEDWQKDIRGLYQFINAFGDAPTDPYYWDFGTRYQKNKWYTFCVPFNMSVDEIENVFGDGTQVCRFSKVTREVSNDATPNKIILEFRKSVMKEGGYVAGEIYPEVEATTTGILHHVPYMIKPGGDANTEDGDFSEDGSRRLPNFKRVGGVMYNDVITMPDFFYSFEGNLEPIPLPNHVYFLSVDRNTGAHKFFFSHNAVGTLSANTASVRVRVTGNGKEIGDVDWTSFFNSKTVSGQAPIFKSLFADDEEATEIEQVEIVCGNDKVDNAKVYTINGVLVNGTNLPAGLYIKNGKKFIVK